jgi:transcription elongation factor GreA
MSDRIPMTRVGYDKLKAEVDEMETVEMPKLAQRVAAARSEGDLSENSRRRSTCCATSSPGR